MHINKMHVNYTFLSKKYIHAASKAFWQ